MVARRKCGAVQRIRAKRCCMTGLRPAMEPSIQSSGCRDSELRSDGQSALKKLGASSAAGSNFGSEFRENSPFDPADAGSCADNSWLDDLICARCTVSAPNCWMCYRQKAGKDENGVVRRRGLLRRQPFRCAAFCLGQIKEKRRYPHVAGEASRESSPLPRQFAPQNDFGHQPTME